jgi:hypothetical protein
MEVRPTRSGPRLLLVQLTKTCFVAPEQWSAIDLVSGDEFYAQARHDKFKATLSNPGGVRVICECQAEPGSTGMMLEWCYADIPDQSSAWATLPKERLT